ncbi:MAG: divergent polysaccharide deacetylase family protein [Thiovulaceae bacterium]|nr:divergent polysaccharide deacetylase family protein [Sulfurimonadaceae bacterium]MCW9026871.1 divergent polysaccharide deacetylase family protein [Sulfurimonadaceae bacterium]
MTKRKHNKSKAKSHFLTYIAWTLAFVTVILASLAIGYYVGFNDAQAQAKKQHSMKEKKRLALLQKLEDSNLKYDKKSVNDRLKEVLKSTPPSSLKEVQNIDATHEYDVSKLAEPPVRKKIIATTQKPKLAIILDDVSVRSQVEAIKRLHLPLTMSFLPPSKARPNSAKLAKKEPFYMVHLPMEAMSFTKEEPFTLRVDDSQSKISKRIQKVQELFPKVKYINNHTGSKFTSNERAVNKLIFELKRRNINFVDSRTIADTKVPKVMKNYGLKYISRDVFLDHHSDKNYVKGQIKQAIRIAKEHGTAIAIGHPHKNTLLAISESKALFKDIELVLIDKVY